jgi:PAS domain S-box-containing protein
MKTSRHILIAIIIPSVLIILVLIIAILRILYSGKPEGDISQYMTILELILVLVLLAWIILQSFRNKAITQTISKQLETTREKYNALMETSADGALLLLEDRIIFANFVFLAMSGYTLGEMKTMKLADLIVETGADLDNLFKHQNEIGKTLSSEALIKCKRGDLREALLAVSGVQINGTNGMIIIVKDISGREKIEKESDHLLNELQSSLLQMNLPVATIIREFITCDMDIPILEAAHLMSRKNQDAIIVMRNQTQPVGILTDTDLRNRVVARRIDFGNPVYEVMTTPIIRIDEQSLLYQAVLKIREHGISHLAMEDKTGRITGILSTHDLLEVQHNSISYLIREIEIAESVESLKKIHDRIPVLTKILLEGGSRIRNITYMISTVTDAITQRLAEFAIEELGEPPARFALMALGSEGRREQTLVTDQDNAIVFEDVPNDRLAEVNRYFLYFGKKINLWLDRIGYRYCQGEVMAGNPQWCQSLSRWKKYFTEWVNTRSEESLLGIAVFFDFRIVLGMEQFGQELRRHIHKISEGKSAFFRMMAKEASGYDVPSELPVSFDVKNALAPLTDYIRVYSIQNQISETNSMLRLDRLSKRNIIKETDYHEMENVYNSLMQIRFNSQVNAILDNKAPDNMVHKEQLTAMERTLVAKSFSEIIHHQSSILDDFS